MRATIVVNTRTVSRIQPISYTASTRARPPVESTMTWTTSSIRLRKLKGQDSVSWIRITISNNHHSRIATPSPTSTKSSNSITTILTTLASTTRSSMLSSRTTTWWRTRAPIMVVTEVDTSPGAALRPIATARKRFSLRSLVTVKSQRVVEAEPPVSRITTSRRRRRIHKTNRAKTQARAFSSPNSRSITNRSNSSPRASRLTLVNLASSSARCLKAAIRLKCKL